MKMIKVFGFARDTVKNPILRFVIVILSVATACSIYFTIAQVNTPDIRGATGFSWLRHWEDLDLAKVKRFYQRYNVDEMRMLWDVKLQDKFGNYAGKAFADTAYPWDTYLTRLLELGHPFIDFSDYESALDTQMGLLMPARTYWHTMNRDERDVYINTFGLSQDTTWETYEEYLIKQRVVYRINWWRSGGIDPFLE